VQATVGTRVPLFINTYQMKVTASAPVWAWGNWYQSDTYRIGDHDIAQIAFSFGLLQTQPGVPVMASEFQAGWLQGANETTPRAAAPENTTIALHKMLQMGVRGVVNFPVQDTRNPAGYEAPWANAFYGWGAALDVNGNPSPRYAPTAAFGALIERFGPLLATMQPQADRAIAWRGDADATIAQLQQCRSLALTCRVYDPRYQTPPPVTGHSSTGGLRDAALLVTPARTRAILDIFNPDLGERDTARTSVVVGTRRRAARSTSRWDSLRRRPRSARRYRAQRRCRFRGAPSLRAKRSPTNSTSSMTRCRPTCSTTASCGSSYRPTPGPGCSVKINVRATA
jgi:hypothetical protein